MVSEAGSIRSSAAWEANTCPEADSTSSQDLAASAGGAAICWEMAESGRKNRDKNSRRNMDMRDRFPVKNCGRARL